jgi:nicotinamidase-related amidase
MSSALVCIDFINEIISSTGKLATKGYFAFAQTNGTLSNLARRQSEMRAGGGRVIHVHLGFSFDYSDHPATSRLLGGARAAGILQLGTSSTEIVSQVGVMSGDVVIVKKRVSAFYATPLELTLRSMGVDTVVLAGVATDLAVQSAARDAHDRDFAVEIAADCCAAACEDDHRLAIQNLSKFSTIL